MGYLVTFGLLLGLACIFMAFTKAPAPLLSQTNAPPEWTRLRPFRSVSPAHHASAMRTLEAFAADYQRTFTAAAAADPAIHVRRLFAHRARVNGLLNELRMRLPNDLTAEKQLAAAMEELDGSMMEKIEDARHRCGAPLVHPGPAGAAWYGAWYRASNDVVH